MAPRLMLTIFVIVSITALPALGYIEYPGPRFPPTKGEVWPKPQKQIFTSDGMLNIHSKFVFQLIGEDCSILQSALARYTHLIFGEVSKSKNAPDNTEKASSLSVARINLKAPCEEWPSLNMDESYTVNVTNEGYALLTSESIWGILRAMETFSQLIYIDDPLDENLYINVTYIEDYPRFSHRGLMLDTSRHHMSLATIMKILDGMSYNKFNVFHWHIVDDQSFPYESIVYPALSSKGAYHPKLVYTQGDVEWIIEYARIRGIRVMSEYDTPGHTRSWGVAYPELLTECYDKNGKPNGDLGPMNPGNKFVYTFMDNLLEEIATVFPDKYIHLGGDEVDFDCWKNNPSINEYMQQHNLTTYVQLEEVYIKKIMDKVKALNAQSVVWQEVFLNEVNIPKDTVIQAWTGNQKKLLDKITSKGHPALLSTCWYLSVLSSGGDWEKFYKCDPHDFPGTEDQKKLVLGGEVCMWGEYVDNNNVLTRIFPRASAAAEKLWSATNADTASNAKFRLEEHYCRMNKRGYPAQPPNGPGYCI